MDRLRASAGVFASAARNRTLLRVGVAYTAFVGAIMGVWVALLVYAYGGGGGATAASVMALVQLVPGMLLATRLGSLADRYRPGRVLFWAYGVLVLSMGAVAVLMAVGAPRWSVFALAAVVNLAVCVPRPAQAVLLPSVVMSAEELAAANAGQGWLESAATLAAPVAVAVLLNAGGAAAAVSGIVVLASVSLLLVATIPGPVPYAQAWESEPDAQDELGSLRLLADNPAVMTLVAVLGAQYILVGALDLIGLGVDLAGIWASWVGGRRRRPALVIGPAACPVWSPFG